MIKQSSLINDLLDVINFNTSTTTFTVNWYLAVNILPTTIVPKDITNGLKNIIAFYFGRNHTHIDNIPCEWKC